MSLSLTDRAAERVREIIRTQGLEGQWGVRVGVKSGGCSGLSYVLNIEQPEDADRVYDSNGVKVFCDPKSYLFVNGTEVDFSSDLMNGGFAFNNPNAQRSCGCGTSFTV